jgi:hypothetical protein
LRRQYGRSSDSGNRSGSNGGGAIVAAAAGAAIVNAKFVSDFD